MPMSVGWDGDVLSKIEAGKKGGNVIFWESSGSSKEKLKSQVIINSLGVVET